MTAGSVFDYSKTPGSNTTIAGINIAAGCPASSVGPAIRQHLADIAESVAHTIIAGGTADALTITFTNIPATLTDGMQLNVRAGAANATTTPTLTTNVTGDTGHTITKRGGTALVAGDIAGALAEHTFRYNLANTRWELIDPTSSALATLATLATQATDLVSLPATSIWTTGDVKITMKTAADTGWVFMNDGSIGDASSGGTTRANADTSALFTLLWTNTANADLAIQDSTGSASTRGVSAAIDFAAHKRMPLPKMLGRALSLAGAGSGLTSRALGSIFGSETHSISTAEMPAHAHPGSSFAATNSVSALEAGGATAGFQGNPSLAGGVVDATYTPTGTVAVASQGSGTAMNLMQPASFLNVMIKL
jgi:microcystin-dependent protein